MASTRKEQALIIIEESLAKSFDMRESVTGLLHQCQRVAMLLGIQDDHEWIRYELEGYPPVVDDSKDVIVELPRHRVVECIATIRGPRRIPNIPSPGLMVQAMMDGEPVRWVVGVTEPCGFLEKIDTVFESVKEITMSTTPPIPVTIFAQISPGRIHGVAEAIRYRVGNFLVSQEIALKFGSNVAHVFDETLNFISQHLSETDPYLLTELTSTIERQQSGTQPIDWRSASDACRNVVQRFTEIILIDEMIPEGEERPPEPRTRDKMSLVVNWAKRKLEGHATAELDTIQTQFDYFFNYFRSLTALVESVKHEPMNSVSKDEVDRVVCYVVLWIADIMKILDRANFDWSKAKC